MFYFPLATETNVSDRMMKFGPIVEASIPTVIVTKENNRQQNTEKENFEEEEEFKKENENGKTKIALKPNEKIRSRGRKTKYAIRNFHSLSPSYSRLGMKHFSVFQNVL